MLLVVYEKADIQADRYAPYEADIRSEPTPPEALVHQVAFDDKGLLIVDIWSSRDALEAWTERRIKPTLAKYDLPYVEPRVLDVDVLATPDAMAHFTQLRPQ